MAEERQGYVRTWLSDAALIVFVVTVTAYASVYLYEFGYCDALGIPPGFVSLHPIDIASDLDTLLMRDFSHLGWPAFFAVVVIFIGRELRGARISATENTNRWQNRLINNFLLLRSSIMLLWFAIAFSPYYSPLPMGFWPALAFAIVILGFGNGIVLLLKLDQLRLYLFEIVAYVAFLVLVSFSIGAHNALIPTSYPFLDSSPDTIVLRVYGDKFVTAHYDSKTGGLTSFAEIDSVGERVHWKQVRLKPQRYGK
jgi:hypothetical protein